MYGFTGGMWAQNSITLKLTSEDKNIVSRLTPPLFLFPTLLTLISLSHPGYRKELLSKDQRIREFINKACDTIQPSTKNWESTVSTILGDVLHDVFIADFDRIMEKGAAEPILNQEICTFFVNLDQLGTSWKHEILRLGALTCILKWKMFLYLLVVVRLHSLKEQGDYFWNTSKENVSCVKYTTTKYSVQKTFSLK